MPLSSFGVKGGVALPAPRAAGSGLSCAVFSEGVDAFYGSNSHLHIYGVLWEDTTEVSKRKLQIGLRLQAIVCKNIYAGLYSVCVRISRSQW